MRCCFLRYRSAAARLHFLHCPLGLTFAGRISCPFLHFLYAMMIASDRKIPGPEGPTGGFVYGVREAQPCTDFSEILRRTRPTM
jgi:hypothetical protein